MKSIALRENGQLLTLLIKGVHDVPDGAINISDDDFIALATKENMRILDGVLVDISEKTTFYISPKGIKEALPLDGHQEVQCDYSSELMQSGGQWKIKDDDYITDRIIEEYEGKINEASAALYTASPIQSAVYMNKYNDAKKYRALGYPLPVPTDLSHYLIREANEKEISSKALADAIIERGDHFNTLGGEIERYRARLSRVVYEAVGETEKRKAADDIMFDLAVILS